MMTDYIAYDDARVGHSRAGNITGILGLGNGAGSAIGSLLVGWLLSVVGYSSGVTASPQLREGLRLSTSLIPNGLLLLMIPLLAWYPLKRQNISAAEHVLRNRIGSTKESALL
jgi:Na+/melibiose symporter-like transporter